MVTECIRHGPFCKLPNVRTFVAIPPSVRLPDKISARTLMCCNSFPLMVNSPNLHEAAMSPWTREPKEVWPGVLNHVPAMFADFLTEMPKKRERNLWRSAIGSRSTRRSADRNRHSTFRSPASLICAAVLERGGRGARPRINITRKARKRCS